MNGWGDVGVYRTCDECGKKFFIRVPSDYTFKRRGNKKADGTTVYYFCLDSCARKWDSKQEPKVKRKAPGSGRTKKHTEITAELLDDLYWNKGMSLVEICEYFKVKYNTLYRYMNEYGVVNNGNGRERPPRRRPRGASL